MAVSPSIPRPRRWDIPFCRESDSEREMTDEDVDRLMGQAPFSQIDPAGFKKTLPLRDILKNDARLVPFQEGDIVVRRGDWGNTAFFIISGSVRVEIEPPESAMPATMLGRTERPRQTMFQAIAQLWRNHHEPEFRSQAAQMDDRIGTRSAGESTRIFLQDVPAVLDQFRTATIDQGQWFGELAALGRTPRTATVFADGPCELLEIRWQGLRDIMRHDRDGDLRAYIEGVFRERALATFLRDEPLFQDLTAEQMRRLVQEVEFETYGNYDSPQPFRELAKLGAELNLSNEPFVARQSEYPNGIILIRSGLARLSEKHFNGHRTVGYLMPGQSYGFPEISQGWNCSSAVPLRYSLTAIGYLNVVIVPTIVVEQLLLETRAVRAPAAPAEAGLGHSQRSSSVAATTKKEVRIADHLLDFMVDHRFVQGTATMVIDLDRCTRCDDCVRACAATHDNNPRFIRHGPVHGQHMVANACLHCADPVCMIECPTGAIHRDQRDGLIVISEQTCIGCAQCANNCPYDAIRMVEIRDAKGQFIVDDKTSRPLMQATKCDLCQNLPGGPACQRACPHDALQRVDLTFFETVGDALQS
ncbi:MAG: cyclic nucleotide-binding domain-containing protein [Planctomycetota bacterium]|nr:cyclic nucleotide-binding domain-containing protein [Planctomycetota bacterium]MDA1164641.1 cyclic nucleotide-binding domain-containing protein [Planctomycetota bacterium]